MINANSVRVGNIIKFSDKLCVVVKTMHTQPGKGGAFVQMELKDIVSGTKYNERYRSEDKVEKAYLEELELQFLYEDGNSFHFMNNDNYEQIELEKNIIETEQQSLLTEGILVRGQFYEGNIISIALPENIQVEIETTESTVKGQTASSSYKPAILTNGLKIMVPPFINDGDKVIIKSTDLSYLERVKGE
jgi:elongation factor P